MGKEQEGNIQNLDNINQEGLGKAARRADRRGSSRYSWKKIVCVSALIGSVIVGVWKGIPLVKGNYIVPEIPYSVTDTMFANKNATFLDEILEQSNTKEEEITLLEKVTQLEAYLDMSNKLSDLKLSTYTKTVIEVTETETFNKDLEDKYQEFVKLSETIDKDVLSHDAISLYTLAAELNGYKNIVDSKITTDGYATLADYGTLVAKVAVLDASGISYTNIENLAISLESGTYTYKYTVDYTDPITDKVFKVDIPFNSIIRKVLRNVSSARTKDVSSLTTEEIIQDLTEYLNDAKVATFMRYTNDGSLKTTNDYIDVREIIEPVKIKK